MAATDERPWLNLKNGSTGEDESRSATRAQEDTRPGETRASGLSGTANEPLPEGDVRELFLELRAPICRYLVSLGLQRMEAEDVAQESFVRLCEQATEKRAENVRAWMFRVAHNLARDEQRRRKRRPAEPLPDEIDDPPAKNAQGAHPNPEEYLLEREQDARLRWALARLPDPQRQCLHLRAEGLKYREIAAVLEAGTSTVAEWVQKGLKQLERDLA